MAELRTTPLLEMPRNLVRALEEHRHDVAPRRAWMAALPLVVEELARRWSLDLGRPFQPGGSTSWVAPAQNAAGERLVLKVGWRHDEALHEAEGLRAWNGDGVVCLFDSVVLGETSALLLETCEPGTFLAEGLPAAQQDAVVAGLLHRLWIEPPVAHGFRTLQTMCDAWADEFEDSYAAAIAPGLKLDPGLVALCGVWPIFSTSTASGCATGSSPGACRSPSANRTCGAWRLPLRRDTADLDRAVTPSRDRRRRNRRKPHRTERQARSSSSRSETAGLAVAPDDDVIPVAARTPSPSGGQWRNAPRVGPDEHLSESGYAEGVFRPLLRVRRRTRLWSRIRASGGTRSTLRPHRKRTHRLSWLCQRARSYGRCGSFAAFDAGVMRQLSLDEVVAHRALKRFTHREHQLVISDKAALALGQGVLQHDRHDVVIDVVRAFVGPRPVYALIGAISAGRSILRGQQVPVA